MHKEIVRGLSAPGGPRVHLLTSATLPDTSTAAPIANDRRAWWLLLGCYLLLRLPLLALNGLDLDEATSTTVAAQNPLAIIRTSATNDIHPPLFYLLLWPFRQMGSAEWWLRLLPLAAGAATLASVWRIASRMAGPCAALWAGLLFAVSPFSIHYTTYLRSFALVTLLSTLALEIALRRWSDPDAASDRWPIAYAFAMAAALYTFYFAAAYWLALALVGGLVLRRSGLLRGWLLANGAVALLFAPWVPVLLQQRRSLAGEAMGLETLAPGAVGHRLLEVLAQLPGNLLTYGLSLPALVTVLMGVVLMVVFVRTVAAAQGAATAAPAVPLLAVPLVAFGLILVAFVPGNAYLQERYSFLLLPPLWIALALALDRIADQPRRAIGAVLGLLYLGGYLGLLQTPGEDFRGAARYLAASVPDRAPVWVIAGFCEVPLAHYWPAGADHLEGLPSFDPDQPQAIPAMVDRLRQLQRDRVSELWVVVSHDQRGAQRRGGHLLAQFLEAQLGTPEVQPFPDVVVYRYVVPQR